MGKKNKHKRGGLPALMKRLPFRSILAERPRQSQWVLVAWEVNGYCGFESIFWDTNEFICQHAVLWMALHKEDIMGKDLAITRKANNNKWPLLGWSHHFSFRTNERYYSKTNIPRLANSTVNETARIVTCVTELVKALEEVKAV